MTLNEQKTSITDKNWKLLISIIIPVLAIILPGIVAYVTSTDFSKTINKECNWKLTPECLTQISEKEKAWKTLELNFNYDPPTNTNTISWTNYSYLTVNPVKEDTSKSPELITLEDSVTHEKVLITKSPLLSCFENSPIPQQLTSSLTVLNIKKCNNQIQYMFNWDSPNTYMYITGGDIDDKTGEIKTQFLTQILMTISKQ